MATENKYVIRLDNTVSYELNADSIIEGVETSYPYPSTSGNYANTFNDISFDEYNDALELLPTLLEVPEYYDGQLTSNHLITAIVKDRSGYVRVAPIDDLLLNKWCFNVYNGIPIYKDNIGTDYSVEDFNADKLAGTIPEHLYVLSYNEGEPVYISYPISASYNTFEVSNVASDTPPVIQHSEWSRYRNGTTLPYKPVTIDAANDNGKILSYDGTSDSIKPTTKNLAEYDPNGVIDGDPLVFDNGKIVSTDELTLENLTVADTATINHSVVQTTEQITSEEDTVVLRENAVTPVPATGAGILINNYDGNDGVLGILSDSNGTVRVGAEGEISDTYENGIFYFNSKVYQKGSGATIVGGSNDVHPTGSMLTGALAPLSEDYSKVVVMPNNDRLGLIINGDYYVTSPIVGGGVATLNITNGETIVASYSQTSDTTFIDNIDNGTDIKDTIYGYSGPVTFGTATDLQPIATREEASDLNNNDILVWNSNTNKLTHITRPTVNGAALKAVISGGVVTGYDWGSSGGNGVAFIGTRTAYETAKLIPEGQDGYIPSGSIVIITDEDEIVLGDEQ